MDEFIDFLALKDEKNALFLSRLIPNISKETILGTKIPVLRKYAKGDLDNKKYNDFLFDLPHIYLEENIFHSLCISKIKNYDDCLKYIDNFLPYIDNWAVCDVLAPKIFEKHRNELIFKIKEWIKSENTYTIRFGIGMLMSHYLDEDFKEEYLFLVSDIKSDEYYVSMMKAWYYATALYKKWSETIGIIENNLLDVYTHNKTIQKAIESRRISDNQKNFLKTLKR